MPIAGPIDRQMVDQLVIQHMPVAFRLAQRLTNDPDAAEDVVQEALCRVLGRWKSYRGEASFSTWLCTNMIDLDAKTVSVTSFDARSLSHVEGSNAILLEVEKYLGTLQRDRTIQCYGLREPDERAFTGFDSFLRVPIDQELYTLAKRWSAGGGLKARIGRNIENS